MSYLTDHHQEKILSVSLAAYTMASEAKRAELLAQGRRHFLAVPVKHAGIDAVVDVVVAGLVELGWKTGQDSNDVREGLARSAYGAEMEAFVAKRLELGALGRARPANFLELERSASIGAAVDAVISDLVGLGWRP